MRETVGVVLGRGEGHQWLIAGGRSGEEWNRRRRMNGVVRSHGDCRGHGRRRRYYKLPTFVQ